MSNFNRFETRWQKIWEKERIYKNYKKQKKFYVLDMFPYPSGEGLHVGHPRGYIATDVIARYKMMQGYSVLHPMGWDAFGLPAENYALKHKIHPKIAVSKNIKRFKEQLNKFGFTYDWDREINTTDPEYYKWTQWLFLKLFENGLVYESFEPIIWCPSCKTGLALEDLEDGKCERCGSEVEKKPLRQWVLKMTAYAEKLLEGLKDLDWPESIKEQQRNWIGRSEGALLKFNVKCDKKKENKKSMSHVADKPVAIEVFTTRLDTIFGCTYLVVAPEHQIIKNLESRIQNLEDVKKYINEAKKKTDLQRTALEKEKTGVELKGIKAINPFNNEEAPVFVADYVLPHYGAGAVMAVPAHDERDFEFAIKYNLPIRQVVLEIEKSQISNPKSQINSKFKIQNSKQLNKAFIDDGVLTNSGEFTGLKSTEAREKMVNWLKKNKLGDKKINYKMRDWVFARQRYWGEPIPLVFCLACKKQAENLKFKIKNLKLQFTEGELLNPGWIQIFEKDLPVKLPEVKHYEPSGTGESPLANIGKWVNTKCPKCGGSAKRETNTMPQWAGSNWYYLAYIMRGISNFQFPISKYQKAFKDWLPVDLYVGGVEHATRHLLYARFWHKFLYDIKVVPVAEPFKKLMNQGLILAEDGRKMSKRWGNVINPDDMIRLFGADALRLYEMFMGPFNQSIAWSSDGIRGMKRFLDKIWRFSRNYTEQTQTDAEKNKFLNPDNFADLNRLLHQTIKKVSEDIENFRFNTAISGLMILFNEIEKEKNISLILYSKFLILLSPFAPHLTEEIWQKLKATSDKRQGAKKFKSIHQEAWPKYNPKLIKEEKFEMIIQINGKVRDRIPAPVGVSQKEAESMALSSEKIKKLIAGSKIKKIIFVPKRLINIVI
jgi:leucyl-tRNA synthetase